jgi:hypothetical protein
MNTIFVPDMGVLSPVQRRIWPKLRPALQQGFVLYGGTAIALRLGHRFSVDFDFFTNRPLDKQALLDSFPFINGASVLQDQLCTFTVLTTCESGPNETVKISFFGMLDFGRVGSPDTTEDGILQVASLDDLMATKVKVILQRVEAKDYRDIAAMLNAGVSLAKGLAAARAMYGSSFQPSESLKAIVYFKGGDLDTLSLEEKDILIKAVSAVRDLPPVHIVVYELSDQP